MGPWEAGSEHTTTDNDTVPHWTNHKRLSWGSNMDHVEYWTSCGACGMVLVHSEDGEEPDESWLDTHRTKECVERRAEAQLSAAIARTYERIFTPEYDQPF